MTKVSVLLITIRFGGLDWQLRYLAQQTHSVDEFIVVDGCYESRHEEIMALARELGVNLIHLPEPELSYHAIPNRCSNVNFAIAHARNPLCVFIDDWHVIPDNFIDTHVKLYNDGYAGVVRWVHTPFMSLSSYDSFAQRLGEEEEDDRILILNKDTDGDVRGNIVLDIPVDWWWPNSTSAPLNFLLAVNGFDEIFNGGTGGEDVDIATRMSHLGLHYAMDTRVTCYHVSHVGIHSRPAIKPMCGNDKHDRKPFTYNEYYKGDPNLVENDYMTTQVVDGIKAFRCKKCGLQGIIDSGEVLRQRQRQKREQKIIKASLESFGTQHTDIGKLRVSLGLPPDGPVE